MMKILLVDDEENIRRALILALSKRGHSIKEAEYPLLALNMLREEYFDLLILDYRMSLLSGLDIAQIVRRNNQDTPIIMLTSHELSEEMRSTAALYGFQMISKDKPLATIVRIIENNRQKSINLN